MFFSIGVAEILCKTLKPLQWIKFGILSQLGTIYNINRARRNVT